METHVESVFGGHGRPRSPASGCGCSVPSRSAATEPPLQLPASRKVRALFAYLAMAAHPVGRSRLCELLWDVPERSARRAALVPEQAQRHPRRTRSPEDRDRRATRSRSISAIALSTRVEVAAAASRESTARPPTGWRRLAGAVCRRLPGWAGARPQSAFRRLADCTEAPLRALAAPRCSSIWRQPARGSDEALRHLETWAELAPFDARAHMMLLGALAERGQLAHARNILPRRNGASQPRNWTSRRFATPGPRSRTPAAGRARSLHGSRLARILHRRRRRTAPLRRVAHRWP